MSLSLVYFWLLLAGWEDALPDSLGFVDASDVEQSNATSDLKIDVASYTHAGMSFARSLPRLDIVASSSEI